MIENVDQRSKDYGDIKDKFRPGHADYTYWKKYGIRDYRGGGRSSARETAMRVAAGAIARKVLDHVLDQARSRSAAPWSRSARTASTGQLGLGRDRQRTPSGAPTPKRPSFGPSSSTACARRAPRPAR